MGKKQLTEAEQALILRNFFLIHLCFSDVIQQFSKLLLHIRIIDKKIGNQEKYDTDPAFELLKRYADIDKNARQLNKTMQALDDAEFK